MYQWNLGKRNERPHTHIDAPAIGQLPWSWSMPTIAGDRIACWLPWVNLWSMDPAQLLPWWRGWGWPIDIGWTTGPSPESSWTPWVVSLGIGTILILSWLIMTRLPQLLIYRDSSLNCGFWRALYWEEGISTHSVGYCWWLSHIILNKFSTRH